MNVEVMAEAKNVAKLKWREYKDALKKNPSNGFFKDMTATYNQLKSGRKLIDINAVMAKCPLDAKGFPKLAIARADSDVCCCSIQGSTGNTIFHSGQPTWRTSRKRVTVNGVIHPLSWSKYTEQKYSLLPMIPPSVYPKGRLSNYYILWEVDKWEDRNPLLPPTDPWLLKRINAHIFVVLAEWELTELERSVMAGRLRG